MGRWGTWMGGVVVAASLTWLGPALAEESGTQLVTSRPGTPPLSPCGKSGGSSCGWRWLGVGACAPGSRLQLTSSEDARKQCASAPGELRVCGGDAPCLRGARGHLRDWTLGCRARRLAVTCPASGRYTLLTRGLTGEAPVEASPGEFPEKAPIASGRRVVSGTNEKGEPLLFKVLDEVADATPGNEDLMLYTIQVWAGRRGWVPWCEPDSAGGRRAVALRGSWDERGSPRPDSEAVTFGCTSGVLGKCVRWGYRPWLERGGHPLRLLHQACARMARADYCGDGVSHTRDGTPIQMQDVAGVRQDPFTLPFEAAWGPDGAECVNHPRWGSLEELREHCPDRLGDRLGEGAGCETRQRASERWPAAVLFNASALPPPGTMSGAPPSDR